MNSFFFGEDISNEGTGIIIPKGLQSRDGVLDAYRSFGFPKYLSRNWNSLLDCLRDLSWITGHLVTIKHEDLPLSCSDAEVSYYVSALYYAAESWMKPNQEHYLKIIFPIEYKEEVISILSEIEP